MSRSRVLLTTALLGLLAAFAVGYVAYAASRSAQPGGPQAATPSGSASVLDRLPDQEQLLFLDARPGPDHGRLSTAPLTAGNTVEAAGRTASDLACARLYAAAGRVLCLRPTGKLAPAYQVVVLDRRLREQRVLDIGGIPSRARLSADGTVASWTVFVSGDSYLSAGFSTRTSVLDLRTDTLVASLESFAVTKDGREYTAVDMNYWGVTVARDNRTFYATLSTGGETYLVRGDLVERRVTTIAENVECPSLSPDNTRLVFKKRVDADGRGPWQLWLLDLASMERTPLAEQRSVDDQATWLDDDTIAYSLPAQGIASYDLWTVPADGTGAASLLVEGGTSSVAVQPG